MEGIDLVRSDASLRIEVPPVPKDRAARVKVAELRVRDGDVPSEISQFNETIELIQEVVELHVL